MCYAFKGEDRIKCNGVEEITKMIYKIPKNPVEDLQEQREDVKLRKKINFLAYILVKYFRTKCLKKDIAFPLFYVLPYRYELDTPFFGNIHIYAEIELTSEWKKFSNNWAGCNNNFYATFSHFTYEMTDEVFMVTDI